MEMVTSSVQRYDTEEHASTVLVRTLPVGDMCLSAAVLNSQVYVVGLEGAFRFTPDSDTWDVLPDMSCPRDFVSLTVLDEKLYAFGGRRRGAKDNLYTDIIECFNPKKNCWENCGTIPVPNVFLWMCQNRARGQVLRCLVVMSPEYNSCSEYFVSGVTFDFVYPLNNVYKQE